MARGKVNAGRIVQLAATGGALAGVAVATAVARNPGVKDDLKRLRRLAQPIGPLEPGPPVAPPLPPGRTVMLPGRGEVFARDTGGGLPPVLLLHGWTLSADLNYFAVYDGLTSLYRVIALDHRGHGRGIRSQEAFHLEDCADDAAALLDELGVGPAVIVGFSMGGALALLLWSRHPERVSGLVLAGTGLEWRESVRERLIWRGMTLFEVALRNGTGDGLIERVVRETIEEYPELEPYRFWASGEFHRGYPADLAAAGRALSLYDARSMAAKVDVPSVVVVTTRDLLVRPAKQFQLAEALGAHVFKLDGDHAAPFNRARQFAAAIRSGVDRVVREAAKSAAAG